ncbi:MAG: GTPase Era [bacterium]
MNAGDSRSHRSGFVTLAGRTNVGKSTLLNRILGTHVAIVSRKPQTTRTRILGAHHFEGGQIVFVDTPGLHKPERELGKRMLATAHAAIADCDVVLVVADGQRGPGSAETEIVRRAGSRPLVLALNKVDLVEKPELLPRIAEYDRLARFVSIHPISAATGSGVTELVAALERLMPEGPPYFPEGLVTDLPDSFLAAELIRAEVMERTGQEIPFSVAVKIDGWEERAEPGDVVIAASILVDRKSQQGMLVGKGGHKVREIGTAARKALVRRFGCPVHLKLNVETAENWTRSGRALDRFGYPDPGSEAGE